MTALLYVLVLITLLFIADRVFKINDQLKTYLEGEYLLRSPLYPVFAKHEVLAQKEELKILSNQVESLDKEVFEILDSRDGEKDFKPTKEQERIMKDYIKTLKKRTKTREGYLYMVQSNLDVLNGKKTIQQVEEEDEYFDTGGMFGSYFSSEEIDNDYKDWLKRINS